jgi:hypothetical protein
MYAFPGAFQGGSSGGGRRGGKKKKKKKKGGGGGGGGRSYGRGGGGSGKKVVARVLEILTNSNGDRKRQLDEIEWLIREQRGGRLDVTTDALREVLVSVLRDGALAAATVLSTAHAGGPNGDTPFTPTDALHILVAMPQHFDCAPLEGAEFVNTVAGMTQFGSASLDAYFRSRCRWAVLEFLSEAAQVMSDIRSRPLDALVRQGKALPSLEYQGPGMKSGEMSFRGSSGGQGQAGMRGIMPGDYVMVTPSDGGRPEEMSVEKSGMPTILKVLDKSGLEKIQQRFERVKTFRVDKLANRTSFARQLAATASMSATPPSAVAKAITSSLLNVGPQIAALCSQRYGNPIGMNFMSGGSASMLNPSQTTAMHSAVSNRLTLVQGPPGTGKTAVACQIVEHWVKTRAFGCDGVLCCSDSNIAVDNMLDGLIKRGINCLRLGRPETTSPHLLQYSLEGMVEACCGPNPAPQDRHQTTQRIIGDAGVVCCTCIGAGTAMLSKKGKGNSQGKKFAGVLIDEAAQATEIAAVVAISLGCEQLVLVGDHHQLPPTVLSDQSQAEGLSLSLFERLVEVGVEPCMLDTQYRMHPAISEFPSDCFYGGRIKDGVSAAARPAPAGLHWPRPDFPVMFIGSESGQESSDGSSKYNDAEVAIVVDLVQQLLASGMSKHEIGVVTPYGSQVRRLRNQLGHRNGLEIQSVDGFQGREKTIIIISAVRSNHSGAVGFLADWCRTNVAVTRARNGLVVIGNEATLRQDKRSWGPFFDWAYAQNVIVGQVVGAAGEGGYDMEMKRRTQALATGRKEFLEKQQDRLSKVTMGGGATAPIAAGGAAYHAAGKATAVDRFGRPLLHARVADSESAELAWGKKRKLTENLETSATSACGRAKTEVEADTSMPAPVKTKETLASAVLQQAALQQPQQTQLQLHSQSQSQQLQHQQQMTMQRAVAQQQQAVMMAMQQQQVMASGAYFTQQQQQQMQAMGAVYYPPAAAGAAADPGLPAGWTAVIDPASGHTYYSNAQLQQTTWERPLHGLHRAQPPPPPPLATATALPLGWISAIDPPTSREYYYNAATKQTTWIKPTR